MFQLLQYLNVTVQLFGVHILARGTGGSNVGIVGINQYFAPFQERESNFYFDLQSTTHQYART